MRRRQLLPESGVLFLICQLVLDQISHSGYVTRGVSLSSNGLSSLGRCGDREGLGTSDPPGTAKKPVNFSANSLPVSDLGRTLSLREDEG